MKHLLDTPPRSRRAPRVAWMLLLLIAGASLAGCGNKGPLVHPEPGPVPAASNAG